MLISFILVLGSSVEARMCIVSVVFAPLLM